MIYLVLFLIAVFLSMIIIRIGTIALRLTGMKWENAVFQSVSAFTGCGFTTSMSENALNDPKRRKIVSWLIILGNAGLITVVVTLIQSVQTKFNHNLVHDFMVFLPVIICLGFLFGALFITNPVFRMVEKYFKIPGAETVLIIEKFMNPQNGHGLARVQVLTTNAICEKTIRELNPASNEFSILAIERDELFIPIPSETEKIKPDDILICYGKLENIRKYLAGA